MAGNVIEGEGDAVNWATIGVNVGVNIAEKARGAKVAKRMIR